MLERRCRLGRIVAMAKAVVCHYCLRASAVSISHFFISLHVRYNPHKVTQKIFRRALSSPGIFSLQQLTIIMPTQADADARSDPFTSQIHGVQETHC